MWLSLGYLTDAFWPLGPWTWVSSRSRSRRDRGLGGQEAT